MQFNEKEVFLTNGAGTTEIHVPKNKLMQLLQLSQKLLKWILDLYI